MTDLVNFHNIKGPNDIDEQIHKLLQIPGVEERVNTIAATLAQMFSVQTKLLVDIRPGATFKDMQTEIDYIYEATVAPFNLPALTTLVLRAAHQPAEELQDQGYFIFRQKGLQGNRYILPLKDFIKCVAIDKFRIINMNQNSEIDVAKTLNL